MMKVGGVAVGNVHHFFNDQITDQKDKFNACVALCTFFVVNSKNTFPFSIPIPKAEHGFLSYDSFLCCSLPCTFDQNHEIPKKSHRGPLSKKVLQEIEKILPTVKTLSKMDRAPISAAVRAQLAQMP